MMGDVVASSRRRRATWPGSAVLIALLVLGGKAASADSSVGRSTGSPAIRASAEEATRGIPPEEARKRQRELHQWLLSELPIGAWDGRISIPLAPEDQSELNQPFRSGTPLKVGVIKPAGIRIDFTGVSLPIPMSSAVPAGHGLLQARADGGFVWTTAIRSEGAAALRVHLTGLDLPPDADLFILNRAGEAFGPYSRRGPSDTGEVWSHTVSGDTAAIVMRDYGRDGSRDVRRASFTLAEIGIFGARFLPAPTPESFCSSGTAPCSENASCHVGTPAEDAKRAVALMEWASGGFLFTCTGGLIADTDPTTQKNLFLTANHCVNRSRDAQNLECFFQYSLPCGNSTCSSFPPADWSQRTLGATIRATNKIGDYTLLELSQNPPASSIFLGWNRTPIAFSSGAKLFRICHPNFKPQAYAEHHVDTVGPTCTSWPRGERIYSQDDVGAVEGGCSGSPVVNAGGEVVGQLSGLCGTDTGNPCDKLANDTVDGALASYFAQIASILDPAGTTLENCANGVDDDGDGLVDCADPDCAGNLDCCLGPGSGCGSGSQCCTGSCKGPSGNKTCR